MTLHAEVHATGWTAAFERDRIIAIGRARVNDVWVGRDLVDGRFTVSKHHADLRWDGSRWRVLNLSDKTGLLHVYEPGFEEVPIEPGRPWVPVRHRWGLAFGQPDHPFHVLCETDDHGVDVLDAATASNELRTLDADGPGAPDPVAGEDDEPTILVDPIVHVAFTPLELEVLARAYRPARQQHESVRVRSATEDTPPSTPVAAGSTGGQGG